MKQAIKLIEEFEGWDSRPYLCPAGKYTIGFGFTTWNGAPVTEMTKPITREQGEAYLVKLLTKLQSHIDNALTCPLNENQNDALLSFCFNVGWGNFLGSTMFKMLNRLNYAGASLEFLRWDKMRQNGVMVSSKGLLRRRVAERMLFDEPCN